MDRIPALASTLFCADKLPFSFPFLFGKVPMWLNNDWNVPANVFSVDLVDVGSVHTLFPVLLVLLWVLTCDMAECSVISLFCCLANTVSEVVWLIWVRYELVGLFRIELMSSKSWRSLSAFGFPVSGILDIFSNKIVWRQDKCRPKSDFSLGGPFVDSAGIHPSSASGLEI